jgi:uncharacterized DUF497 family protein
MYEWDEAKRRGNIAKHRVDFALIVEIFEGAHAEGKDIRFSGPEPRHIALGEFEGKDYIVIFTWRGDTRRIISAWAVGARSKRRYQTLLNRGVTRSARAR